MLTKHGVLLLLCKFVVLQAVDVVFPQTELSSFKYVLATSFLDSSGPKLKLSLAHEKLGIT